MYSCVICGTNSSEKNITFHPFPKDMVQRDRWLRSLKLSSCTDTHRVCSDHFSPNDFRSKEKRLLQKFAAPKLCPMAKVNKTNNDNTTQVATMNSQHDLKQQVNNVTNNTTISSSAIHFTPRRSIRKRKPRKFSSSDEDEINKKKINKIKKKKKKNIKNTKDKQESEDEEYLEYFMTTFTCCVPGCVCNSNFLNTTDVNAKFQSDTLFSPSSIEIMNKWSSILGISLTMSSFVCARHFKPKDIQTHKIFISYLDLYKFKELSIDAVPINTEKMINNSEVSNINQDISVKKNQ